MHVDTYEQEYNVKLQCLVALIKHRLGEWHMISQDKNILLAPSCVPLFLYIMERTTSFSLRDLLSKYF